MKKLPVILCTCLAVAGCTTFDPDLDRSAARREADREAYHQEFGCHFAGDHDSYRTCLLNTYHAEKPKTFSVTQDEKGRSVAIIKDETKQSYDKSTDTYKTERVIVIETEERLVPVPVAPAPVPVAPTPVVETCDDETVLEPLPPEPVVEAPAPTTVDPKDTWWDTYKKNKTVEDTKCPCTDPNEPCPQCVDK